MLPLVRPVTASGLPDAQAKGLTYRSVAGGFLVQTRDNGRITRQMLKVVMDAMPRADASAIVRIPADAPANDKRLVMLESNVRPNSSHGQSGFAPSKRLSHRAIVERRVRVVALLRRVGQRLEERDEVGNVGRR